MEIRWGNWESVLKVGKVWRRLGGYGEGGEVVIDKGIADRGWSIVRGSNFPRKIDQARVGAGLDIQYM